MPARRKDLLKSTSHMIKTERAYHIIPSAFLLTLIIMLFGRCAKEVATLQGGSKDTIPPEVVESDPPNYTVHFDAREIEIEFNEFIQLNEVQQQFLSSPPFKEMPEIKMKGKGIEIALKDTLRDSTTYSLNFGNAIADYTEGNPIRNFKYVFSTGDALDSMEVKGRVYDAFNRQPRENVLVMLYDERKDSVPYKELPNYVSRTDEKGFYRITNVRNDTFKLFALDDHNSNYLYDNPAEDIAFVDSAVIFERGRIEEHDTVYAKDTVAGAVTPDTSVVDTVIHRVYRGYPPESFDLSLFNEDKEEQYLKTFQRTDPMRVDFVFNAPVKDSLRVALPDTLPPADWYLKEVSERRDTITYWLRDTSLYHRSYLTFELGYQAKDSLNNLVWTTDTVEAGYTFEEGERESVDTLLLNTNVEKPFDLNRNIRLSHPYPVKAVDTGRIVLQQTERDSVVQKVDFQLHMLPESNNAMILDADLQPEASYKLKVLPQAVRSIYGVYHDTLMRSFNTRAEDYYGSLKVELTGMDSDFILQLLQGSGEEETVIREKYPAHLQKGVVHYRYLDPGEYFLKIIYDKNGNKEWDTGNYLEHRQPEKVDYNPEKLDIRSNWEYEVEWDVKDINPQKERSQ
jgi:hypothetical protein